MPNYGSGATYGSPNPTAVTSTPPSVIQQIVTLLVQQVGDLDPTTLEPPSDQAAGVVYQNAWFVWSRYADKDLIYPRLREWFTRRDLIDLCLGALSSAISYSIDRGGDSEQQHQKVETRQKQREEAQAEIDTLLTLAQANRTAQIGQLTTTAPQSAPGALPSPYLIPDSNDPRYSGSPYYPRTSRW